MKPVSKAQRGQEKTEEKRERMRSRVEGGRR